MGNLSVIDFREELRRRIFLALAHFLEEVHDLCLQTRWRACDGKGCEVANRFFRELEAKIADFGSVDLNAFLVVLDGGIFVKPPEGMAQAEFLQRLQFLAAEWGDERRACDGE